MITFRSIHDWTGCKWQVIYRCTVDGKEMDYCRESYSSGLTKDQIEARARAEIARNKHLSSAVIERW